MTHRDGLPRLSDGVAHALRCPASPQRTLLAENLGKPPFRSSMRPVGGRRKVLTMPRIACGSPPARRIARAISMGHYQRDLV